jgi:hypothetical protein
MESVIEWLQQLNHTTAEWLLRHSEIVYCFGAAIILEIHFRFKGRGRWFMVLLITSLVIASSFIFIVLSRKPEAIPFKSIASALLIYGVGLFVILCELMLWRFARYLTVKRGEKWVKEMDYLYLSIGALGILASMNRVDFLTGRLEGTDILAPLVLATAVVIRFIKTRAEIAGWNKPEFHNSPTVSPSDT